MAFSSLIIPLLVAAATPATNTPATAAPATAISPSKAAPAVDTSTPVKLEFPLAGYRINTLEELSKQAKALPWMGSGFSMFPHGDIFSLPRMSAGILATADSKRTMAELVKNEKAGHVHFGDPILSDHMLSATEWQVEYLSGGHGEKEHVYERVLLANGQFYHALAIESESRWAKTGPALKAWVNSLETISGPGVAPAAASPGKLVFPQRGRGFRINSPDAAPTSDKNTRTLMLAHGLTVTTQAYAKTLQDLQAETKTRQQNTQDKEAQYKIKIVAESFPAENTWVIEFMEELPMDKINHFVIKVHTYQKVILAHGQLYRAVASMGDYEEVDPAYFAKLKASVDSLEAMAVPAPASAPVPDQTPASAK